MTANWKNRTVWTGDNLAVMRGMNSESVDLIYLDPPFNSNRNYAAPIGSEAAGAAFKDTWTLSDVDEAWHGEIADRRPGLYAIIDAAGLAHGESMKAYLITMAVRLMEMHRLLKPTGSVYLHCDPTASHYLKALMDAVFGAAQFKNEVIWKRTSGHSDSRTMGAVHDVILHYSKSATFKYNVQFAPYDDAYVERRYKHRDPDGRRFMDDNLTARGLQGGGYVYEYKGVTTEWRVPPKRMEELDRQNRLYVTKRGGIRIKRYLDEMKGVPVNDVWTDIAPINSQSRERLGYPTQKPTPLLERIISASSDPDDMVLDPFCGCATALVAADRLQRRWVGIDLSPLAVGLVEKRLRDAAPGGPLKGPASLLHDVHHREDVPVRTDFRLQPHPGTHKHTLFGRQEGKCAGCRMAFPFRNMTIDHITPRSRGGQDNFDNLQLLCGACNSTKGAGTQEELVAKLRKQELRP